MDKTATEIWRSAPKYRREFVLQDLMGYIDLARSKRDDVGGRGFLAARDELDSIVAVAESALRILEDMVEEQ